MHIISRLDVRTPIPFFLPQVAATLNNLADVHAARGHLDDAVAVHSQALDIQEQHAPGSLHVATTLNNMAAVLQASE